LSIPAAAPTSSAANAAAARADHQGLAEGNDADLDGEHRHAGQIVRREDGGIADGKAREHQHQQHGQQQRPP
jgi:hypothetical protein